MTSVQSHQLQLSGNNLWIQKITNKNSHNNQMKKSVLALASCALIASCGDKPQQAKVTSAYPIALLDTASATIFTDYATEIKSGTVVEIRPRISGYIDKILVEEGSHVSRGQAILKIDQADILEQYNTTVANVDGAKAKVENANLEVQKLTPLVAKNIISPFELKNAESNLVAAQAALTASISQMNNAKINLSYATITSPVDGVIGRIVAREGTLVSPQGQDPLTSVSGDGEVSAYFSIDENTVLDLASAQQGSTLRDKVSRLPQVTLLLSNGQIYDRSGRIELASGLVDMTTGSYQLKGVFPNPDNLLRSGSSGVVRMSEYLSGVILVPKKATYEMQDKKMVFVLDSDNKLRSQALVVEGNSGENYVVSAGVSKGDRILLEGLDFVKDGEVIKIKN